MANLEATISTTAWTGVGFTWTTESTLYSGGTTTFVMIGVKSATEAEVTVPWPAMIVTAIRLTAFTAPAGAETLAVTLRDDGADTGVTAQLDGAEVDEQTTGLSVTIAEGSLVCFKVVASAGIAAGLVRTGIVIEYTEI